MVSKTGVVVILSVAMATVLLPSGVSAGGGIKEADAALGNFELVGGLKSENVTKLLKFMQFKDEVIAKISGVSKVSMSISGHEPKYLVLFKGFDQDIKYDFENNKQFDDKAVDGRSRKNTVAINGRVATTRQVFDGAPFTAQHVALFNPAGCEITLSATSNDGSVFHMARLYLRRV